MQSEYADLVINRGVTYLKAFVALTDSGTAFDLSGYALRGQARRTYTSSSYTDLTVSAISGTSGAWSLGLAASQTALIDFTYGVYDVIASGTNTIQLAWGNVLVLPEVTR